MPTQLSSILEAEFQLHAYCNQPEAILQAELSSSCADGLELTLAIQERWNGCVPTPGRRVHLCPGTNAVAIPIRDWPTGEYRVALTADGYAGELPRLLRIDRITPAAPPASFGDLSGKRLYFPDAWYLEDHSHLEFRQFLPEVHYLDLPQLSGPTAFSKWGAELSLTTDGRLMLAFQEHPNDWSGAIGPKRHAICTPGEWQWTLATEPLPAVALTDNAEIYSNHCQSAANANPVWNAGEEGSYRFYDVAKDGPVVLSQLVLQYSGYRELDWGIVKAPRQSTWLVWHKDGERILLQKTPFLQDSISDGEFEALSDTNDNLAGQWLSDDGKTLFYVRGHMLRRYPPMQVPYDNLWPAARQLTIFYTHDGLHWERHYFAPPDESDTPCSQQYGACLHKAPRGNGLIFGFATPYRCREQQFDIELDWSWDGVEWRRPEGHRRWIPCGEPGTPSFGCSDMGCHAVEKEDMVYQLIERVEPHPHFAFEVNTTHKYRHLTGEDVQSQYESRHLREQWPHWKHYGSWEAIAQEWNQVLPTTGIAVYRKGGLFGIVAGKSGGGFTTRPISATGKLTANIKVLPGGKARFRLLDMNEKELAAAELPDGANGIALPLFETLPNGPFRIAAELANVELYTLNFE